jgi:hypothetical protein
MSYAYDGSEILDVFESEASALIFATEYKTGTEKYTKWGESKRSDDDSSLAWSDGRYGTLAVERHEVKS